MNDLSIFNGDINLYMLEVADETEVEQLHRELYQYKDPSMTLLYDIWEDWMYRLCYTSSDFDSIEEHIFDYNHLGTSVILHLWCKLHANVSNQDITIHNFPDVEFPEYLRDLKDTTVTFSNFQGKKLANLHCKHLIVYGDHLEDIDNVYAEKITVYADNLRSVVNLKRAVELSIMSGSHLECLSLPNQSIIKNLSLSSKQCLIEGTDIQIERLNCLNQPNIDWINSLNVQHVTVPTLPTGLVNSNIQKISIKSISVTELHLLEESINSSITYQIESIDPQSLKTIDIKDVCFEGTDRHTHTEFSVVTAFVSESLTIKVTMKNLHDVLLKAPTNSRIFTQLNILDLSEQSLTSVPSYINHFEHLQELDLSNNQLVEANLRTLKELRHLDLSHNPLEKYEISRADSINLSNTHITYLPSLSTLEGVSRLNITNCSSLNPTWQELSRLHAVKDLKISWSSQLYDRYQQLRRYHHKFGF